MSIAKSCWLDDGKCALLICASLIAFALPLPVQGGILASSSLETCTQSSSTDIQCQKKMVLTLSVPNTQNLVTQSLDFQLSCIGRSVSKLT